MGVVSSPVIVPEGGQMYGKDGVIVLVREFSRPVTIECDCCDLLLPLRLCADDIPAEGVCDSLMDDYLRSLGWSVDPDVCPDCAKGEC